MNRPTVLLGLLGALLLVGPVRAAEMQILDLEAALKPTQLMSYTNMKAVKVDKNAFITDFTLEFVTKGEWVAGGSGYHKDISAALGAKLTGIPDATYQAIVDEAFAYAQTKFGETFSMVPDAEVLSTLMGFEKIAESPNAIKQEQLGVETPYLKVFASKKFVPGGKVRPAATGASGMGAYKAWYKAQSQLKGTNIAYTNKIEFARVASSLGGDSKKETATVSVNPQLFMVGGGAGFSSTNMKMGMLQPKDFGGFKDASWVKETKKLGDGTYEIVADPDLYKAAAVKLVSAHIDAMVAAVKENQ